MRFYFFIIFFCYVITGYSQPGYKIVYKLWRDDSPFKSPVQYFRLVFNDSMSGCYRMISAKKDPMKKDREYGNIIYQHQGMIYNKNTNLFYGTTHGHARTRNKKHIIYYPPGERKWTYSADSKKILGYDCKKAYWINEYFIMKDDRQIWFTDSTIAWYAEQIKLPFGPFSYTGFPGVVLEYQDQQNRSFNLHIRAEKIEKNSISINLPKDGVMISLQEFREIIKNQGH